MSEQAEQPGEHEPVQKQDRIVLTTAPMPFIHTCSTCGVQWSGSHECPSVNRSTSAPKFTGNVQMSEDPYAAGLRLRGSWEDPRIVSDSRIDHENPVVRHVAERLHANESMHLHDDISGKVCVYCALRASRCLAWEADYFGRSGGPDD